MTPYVLCDALPPPWMAPRGGPSKWFIKEFKGKAIKLRNMRSIGSGFEVTNYPTIEQQSNDPDIGIYDDIDPDAYNHILEIVKTVRSYRGEIISTSVDIEYLLSESISRFFLEDTPEKRDIFHELLLDTTYLTFAQKKNLLKSIMDKYPQKFGDFSDTKRRKAFFENIENIIKWRNALAHGRIIIDYNSKIVTILAYNSNKHTEESLEINSKVFLTLRRNIVTALLEFVSGISLPPSEIIGYNSTDPKNLF